MSNSSSSLQPILALLGHPVAGNPAQYMAEKAFAHHALDWRYLTLDVTREQLGDAVRGLRAMGFRGGNCAQPHKQAVIPLLDRTTKTAELAGAVNLIVRDDDALVGENTEGKALVELLRGRTELAEKRIVLLGAGRMARAVGIELAAARVAQLVVVNRTEAHAAELVELIEEQFDVPGTPVVWADDYSLPPETDVLINATSAAQGDPEATLPLNPEGLHSHVIVADVSINPPRTWLLREAEGRGCATLDGVEVLVNRTAIDLKLWTGVEPGRTVLREAVEEFLEL